MANGGIRWQVAKLELPYTVSAGFSLRSTVTLFLSNIQLLLLDVAPKHAKRGNLPLPSPKDSKPPATMHAKNEPSGQ